MSSDSQRDIKKDNDCQDDKCRALTDIIQYIDSLRDSGNISKSILDSISHDNRTIIREIERLRSRKSN